MKISEALSKANIKGLLALSIKQNIEERLSECIYKPYNDRVKAYMTQKVNSFMNSCDQSLIDRYLPSDYTIDVNVGDQRYVLFDKMRKNYDR